MTLLRALAIAAFAYRYARRHAQDRRFVFGTGKLGDLAGSEGFLRFLRQARGYLKDVRLICELAESFGFKSPTLDNCSAQWEKFVHEEGHGDVDHSGLFLLYDKR